MSKGFLVGARGSVGSSLAATMSGITEVNPLQAHYLCPDCKYTEFFGTEVDSCYDLPDKKCPCCGKELKKEGFNIPFESFMVFYGYNDPVIELIL